MGKEMTAPSGVYDYRSYDRVWQRVDPSLNPYPEVRGSAAAPARIAPAPPVPPVYQALLREELRHMREVLRVLENALA